MYNRLFLKKEEATKFVWVPYEIIVTIYMFSFKWINKL